MTYAKRDDTYLHGRRRQRGQLLLHTVSDTREHSGTTREDNVSVQVATNIEVALEDGVVGGLVDTGGFETEEGRLEEGLRSTESTRSNEPVRNERAMRSTYRSLPIVIT